MHNSALPDAGLTAFVRFKPFFLTTAGHMPRQKVPPVPAER
jgi:hypothetical protein